MNKIKRINTEKTIIYQLIRLYCKDKHHTKKGLCEECDALYRYTLKRIDNCVFGLEKPTCQNCPVHCYKAAQKQKVIKVMRYSGPKMIYMHPVSALIHVRNKIIDKKKIPALLLMLKQKK